MSQAPTLKNDQIESSPDTSLKSGVWVVLFLIKELVDTENIIIFLVYAHGQTQPRILGRNEPLMYFYREGSNEEPVKFCSKINCKAKRQHTPSSGGQSPE